MITRSLLDFETMLVSASYEMYRLLWVREAVESREDIGCH